MKVRRGNNTSFICAMLFCLEGLVGGSQQNQILGEISYRGSQSLVKKLEGGQGRWWFPLSPLFHFSLSLVGAKCLYFLEQ